MTFICRNADDAAYDEALIALRDECSEEDEPQWTYADQRRAFDRLSDRVGELHGFPIPLPDLKLRLHDRHPLRGFYKIYDVITSDLNEGDPVEIACSDADVDETVHIRNQWWSDRLNAHVVVVQDKKGIHAAKIRKSPNDSMRRLDLWLRTCGASDAWDVEAEINARIKLADMVSERQFHQYELTGTFLETSKRSGVTYLFRRLRPTVAMGVRDGHMWFLAALCLHPLGFYEDTWAGCMVPTDDVIAHLTMMRGDEADFWGKANQHAARVAEAGL